MKKNVFIHLFAEKKVDMYTAGWILSTKEKITTLCQLKLEGKEKIGGKKCSNVLYWVCRWLRLQFPFAVDWIRSKRSVLRQVPLIDSLLRLSEQGQPEVLRSSRPQLSPTTGLILQNACFPSCSDESGSHISYYLDDTKHFKPYNLTSHIYWKLLCCSLRSFRTFPKTWNVSKKCAK